MERKTFQFKQFSVSDQNSALKLNTDGVLLGAWANINKEGKLLDIGTGCGILALMAAQKATIPIIAIDIDKGSISDARKNFHQSPWGDRLKTECISIQQFARHSSLQFHQIISNPPFFTNSLKSPFEEINLSKHNDSLSQEDLIIAVNKLLFPSGKFFTILPVNENKLFIKRLEENQLYIHKQTSVIPRVGKKASRILFEISGDNNRNTISDKLVIRNIDGTYTKEYKYLTADFYLNH